MPNQRFIAESPESIGIDPEKLEAVFDRAEKEVREGLLPSAQIAIARNGKLAGMRTFGRTTFTNHDGSESQADATNETLYAVFSSTKALTSAAAWLLIQEGKLDPSEIVSDIIPEFGTNGKEGITVEQLFIHTAGFPTAPFPPPLFHDPSERLRIFAQWRLNFEPGSQFTYHPSSSMYVVGDIIERRSGMTYGDFVRQRVALPLGLETIWVGLPDELHPQLANIEHVGDALTEAEAQWSHPTTMVVVTSSPRPEWVGALEQLARRRVKVASVLVDGHSFGGFSDSLQSLPNLESAGIPTYVVSSGDDIPTALSQMHRGAGAVEPVGRVAETIGAQPITRDGDHGQ